MPPPPTAPAPCLLTVECGFYGRGLEEDGIKAISFQIKKTGSPDIFTFSSMVKWKGAVISLIHPVKSPVMAFRNARLKPMMEMDQKS